MFGFTERCSIQRIEVAKYSITGYYGFDFENQNTKKDLAIQVCVVVRSLNSKILRKHLANYGGEIYYQRVLIQKIIFLICGGYFPLCFNSLEITDSCLLYKHQCFITISATEKSHIFSHVKIRYFYM